MKLDLLCTQKENDDETIVRVATSYWSDNRGIHTKRSLLFLRRRCKGYNQIEEDVSFGGAEVTIRSIKNILDVEDGIYAVSFKYTKDYWGEVDFEEYELIPVGEENEQQQQAGVVA
jgi:hypothetical protein